jgi:hypothetical protein
MFWVKRYKWGMLFFILLMADLYWFVIRDMVKNQPAKYIISNTRQLQEGKALVVQYCQSCHRLPDPSLLNKEMWDDGVLPRMGPFLGITTFRSKAYFRANDVDLTTYFPSKPVIDSVKWQRIVSYYTTLAPEVLHTQKQTVAIINEMPFFEIKQPNASYSGKIAMASYVKIDTSVKPHRLIVADAGNKKLMTFDAQLNMLNMVRTDGPVTDIDFTQEQPLACIVGKSLEANNKLDGAIIPINLYGKPYVSQATYPRFNNLARPVNVTTVDLNKDGKTDYLVSEFGNLVGKLSWMENKGNGKFKTHILRNRPGALSTVVQDVNADGLPDIWGQFAQGDEGIFLYTNKGYGRFEERRVLSFPPSYGSTSFSLVDFNHDGYSDIIYTCGDNGDYTEGLKPYHGVYIYLNDGENNFRQKCFYPVNGCYKAIAKDFDGDGNIDIATISFYPADDKREQFLLLKNKGNYNFQAYALPVSIPFSLGLTMDAGDLDGEGQTDLVLGNGFYNSGSTSTNKEPLFILLKNISKPVKR